MYGQEVKYWKPYAVLREENNQEAYDQVEHFFLLFHLTTQNAYRVCAPIQVEQLTERHLLI